MIPLWRVTRNRFARRVYEGLAAAGVTATRMVEFEADVASGATTDGTPSFEDVSFETVPATDDLVGEVDLQFSIPVSFLDGEWAVVALADGAAVGRALVSAGQRPYVEPLGTEVSFEGAYVRRVYVDRQYRNRGIAKRLVGETRTVADGAFGVDTAHALIAVDNKPSQWVFEANGFRPVRRHDYVRLFGLERRRVTRTG